MVEARTLWLLLPRPIRALPADLAAVLALVVATNLAVLAPLLRDTPLRIPLGLAFVLFVPGYAFIAALFPETGESPTEEMERDDGTAAGVGESGDVDDDAFLAGVGRSGIDGIERVALAFGLSIAIVPLIGLVLNFTPWGIRLLPIMLAVSGFTVLTAAVAAARRWELPPVERFRVPYREWYTAGHAEVFEPETRTDAFLNVALAASIVLAVGAVGFAVLVPPQGEQFSAVYVLTEDDDGELVADGYPSELELGEAAEIIVGVDNNEHRTVDYTVVVVEQRVETAGNQSSVEEQRELDRFETSLAHDESWHYPHAIEPTFVGDEVRVAWLLFLDDEVPDEPTIDDTEYSVHIWIDVLEDGS